MKNPRLSPVYHVELVEPDGLFLIGEHGHQIISGPVYRHLAPLLTGEHSVETIVARLAGAVAPLELLHALRQLGAKGLVEEAGATDSPAAAAFWRPGGVSARAAGDRLAQAQVAIATVGTAEAGALAAALGSLSIAAAGAESAEPGLRVVLTDDYLRPELAEHNQAALAAGRPWLLARLVGATLWLGPLFVPGETACWACMAPRIRGNRQVEAYLRFRSADQTPFATWRPALASTAALGANLLATALARLIVQGDDAQLRGQLTTFHTLTSSTQRHPVVRRPQCPACGDPGLTGAGREPRPIALASRRKIFTADGGHRSRRPEETVAAFERHISPITGVISSLTDMTEGTGGITYSYAAGHNFAMVNNDLSYLRTNMRSRSGGKGMTDVQARASAVGEAIERYSGVFRGEEEIVREGSYRELAPQALDLREVLQFSPAQYAGREAWNAGLHASYHHVPRPFDEGQRISWTPLWSLARQEFRSLPTTYCYYGSPDRNGFCIPDSNGCAAGNTIEEAILQGFLELVERDGVALWWYNRIRRPAVDVDSFGLGDYHRTLQTFYRSHGRSLWVLDLTADLGISTFAAISGRVDSPVEDIIVGYGAHLDPQIALLRALTELNQFLPMVIHRSPDGSTWYPVDDLDTLAWFKTATMAANSYLVPDPSQPARTAADHPSRSTDDMRADVEVCVAAAAAVGLDTLVLDQTRPDIGLAVCRVVVPGLRHFWRRLGPGRLYDIPVQLGWLAAPTAEQDMNPVSMFF